jgi:hypothetical protein
MLQSAVLLASVGFIDALIEKEQKAGTLFKDDQLYWTRLLTNGYSVEGSLPSLPPTPSPLLPTTKPPAELPTAAPGIPCDVSVNMTCTISDDPEKGCEVLERVTQLQCQGCAPTTLCFTYTGATCPENEVRPPGMKSCSDMLGGPQPFADITIFNGNKTFVDQAYELGDEVCITDDGAELPEELVVIVKAPMGGNEPMLNQRLTIDSSCQGQGLTLLQSYGALDLVHYVNCEADNNCFVPITFAFTVMNDGQANFTITELEGTCNGDTQNLIAGINPSELLLEEGETFVSVKPFVAECCSELIINASAIVTAEGDNGSKCKDNATLIYEKPIDTSPPIPSPSPAPTKATPSPVTAQPTPLPTSKTTSPTSPTPTRKPTANPTIKPSTTQPSTHLPTIPTVSPITSSPTVIKDCQAELIVECIPPVNETSGIPYENCDFPPAKCLETATLMTFRYDGGDCSDSFNIQDPTIYTCQDFFGGPPRVDEIGVESLIIVTDDKDLNIIYFSGLVPVGGSFNITNPKGDDLLLGANVNVTIYNGDKGPRNIRQTMIINTDNSQVTFIKDRYGSLFLIAFQNSLQGFVDCFFDVFFKYSAISSESRASTVDTLTSIVGGFFPENSPQARLNFTAEVAGTTLPPKKQVVLAESGPLTIDYSSRNTYSVLSNMQLSTNGSICKTTTFLIITAGVADARPTSAPTIPPSPT